VGPGVIGVAPGAGAGDGAGASLRIGEVALEAGVTTRTLRYYQELGLLDPGRSPGAIRRYCEADVIRLKRILELRDVMGFDLERIRAILSSEDRLAELRAEAKRGASDQRRREILAEAIAINRGMQEQVRDKRAVLDGFLLELEARAAYYAAVAVELGLPAPAHAEAGPEPEPEPEPEKAPA
jgi:DNA-binding transcriptional MerR regulator